MPLARLIAVVAFAGLTACGSAKRIGGDGATGASGGQAGVGGTGGATGNGGTGAGAIVLHGHLDTSGPAVIPDGGAAPTVILSRGTLMVPASTTSCTDAGVCLTGGITP